MKIGNRGRIVQFLEKPKGTDSETMYLDGTVSYRLRCSVAMYLEPFNAEPHRSGLISSYVTPVDLFYKRNHGPLPIIDEIKRYRHYMTGLINIQKELSMKDIRDVPRS